MKSAKLQLQGMEDSELTTINIIEENSIVSRMILLSVVKGIYFRAKVEQYLEVISKVIYSEIASFFIKYYKFFSEKDYIMYPSCKRGEKTTRYERNIMLTASMGSGKQRTFGKRNNWIWNLSMWTKSLPPKKKINFWYFPRKKEKNIFRQKEREIILRNHENNCHCRGVVIDNENIKKSSKYLFYCLFDADVSCIYES